jgi:uncharacterized short protein YbdD (DUF466 family)
MKASARTTTALLRRAWNGAVRTARLAIGISDYATYVRHLRTRHPERPVPSYEEFFRACQERRYRGGGTRGCC